MQPKPTTPLDQETALFIQRHVSINLATTDQHHRPAVTRAYGCRVSHDRTRLTVFIAKQHNQAVIANVLANGAIAVVFTRPTTHQSLQFKGIDATLVDLEPGDPEMLLHYRDSLTEELQGIGFPSSFSHTLIPALELIDTALRFTVTDGFSQTPGPQAGKKISV